MILMRVIMTLGGHGAYAYMRRRPAATRPPLDNHLITI
jgi:hypothetical protein